MDDIVQVEMEIRNSQKINHSLSEEEGDDEVKELAQRSPATSENQAGKHYHKGLQGQGNMGDGDFDKCSNRREGSEKRDHDQVVDFILHLPFILRAVVHLTQRSARCQIALLKSREKLLYTAFTKSIRVLPDRSQTTLRIPSERRMIPWES